MNYFKIGNVISKSVEDNFSAKTISIYPNPADNGFVTFSETLNNVNVYNNVGQVVYAAASTKRFDVSDFSSGLYLVSSNEGVSKLIVK
ncbi:MAG: T9SS type A sorting domain-containing protein [Flavobacteriales bacterium]